MLHPRREQYVPGGCPVSRLACPFFAICPFRIFRVTPRASNARVCSKAQLMNCKLENPTFKHQDEFLAAVRRSQKLHRPWVSPPTDAASFKAYIERYASPSNVGFFVRVED